MAHPLWYKALSYLPGRFHTAASPREVMSRLSPPPAPQPEPTPVPAPAHVSPTAIITAQVSVPRTLTELYAATCPAIPAPMPVPAPDLSPFPTFMDIICEPPFEQVPDELLMVEAAHAPDADGEAPHWEAAPVEPPASTLERLAQQHEEAEASRQQAGGDAFHLPDFQPGEVDDAAAFLSALRGRGQHAIRLGLQTVQSPN